MGNTPNIRFKGFTDDWEQRKLSDVAELTSSKRIHAEDYVDSGIPFYRGKEISELRVQKPVSEVLYITEEMYEEITKIYGSPKKNDLLITAVGTLGNTWVVDNLPFYFKDGNLIWFKNIKCNSRYLDYALGTSEGQKKIMESAIGSNQKALTMVKLNELKYMFPNEAEQEQIATYFTNLDNLITLHQRKCDDTKELKNYMLQKMFPQNGDKNPEIRFEGFTDDWELRKVGEFLTESKIKGSDGSVAKKLTVKLWRKGIIPKEEIYQGSSATQYYVRKSGQFMYGKLDFLNQAFGIIPPELDGYESTLDSPAFDFLDGINPRFFLEYICLEKFYKFQGNIANGSRKAKRIHTDTFFEMPISIPGYKEQQTIGLMFERLDNLITLHQRKCNELKELKKFMLQNMFPQKG